MKVLMKVAYWPELASYVYRWYQQLDPYDQFSGRGSLSIHFLNLFDWKMLQSKWNRDSPSIKGPPKMFF